MADKIIKNLLSNKKSDSIVVLGSGYSINRISNDQWNKIKKIDSIGFNWFCKHSFVPNFYLVREQANIPTRVSVDESPQILINTLNSDRYKECLKVVLDTSSHCSNCFSYNNKFNNSIILKDRKKGKPLCARYCKKDINSFGVFHGFSTMTSILHIIMYMKYKIIYFAGVDLNDSRYFWLPKNKVRHTIKRKNRSAKDIHPIARKTIKFIRRFKEIDENISLFVINKKSLLTKIVPYQEI